MKRIVKFIILDIMKNKTILVYTILLMVLSWSVFNMEDNNTKGILTLLNVILLTVPLVSVVFSCIYLYNSAEFIELLLSQPVKRVKIWWSLFLGLTIAFVLSFLVGVGIPLLIYTPLDLSLMMLMVGSFVTTIFIALAFISSIITRDKAKGIGIAILMWLFFALLFDGIVLFLLFQFSEYPIDKYMVVVSALNPIDLSRILILLHLDVSAMMGYTGAIFKQFFGTEKAIVAVLCILMSWTLIPFLISIFKFKRKDL